VVLALIVDQATIQDRVLLKVNKMEKPQSKIKQYYDYHECRNYLQEKYGYDERDFSNQATKGGREAQTLDFWYWVIEHDDIHNGCFVIFSKEILEDEDTDWTEIDDKFGNWQKEIYQHYIDEFADENGEVEFYVWW